MAFEGPDTRDYENVVSLNRAYLLLLKQDDDLRRGLGASVEPVRQRVVELTEHQVDRLSATPFLLFSFHEQDDRYWNRVLQGTETGDLFTTSAADDVDILVSAALGFVWQLARRNPYVLRLFCGATLYWCERIADLTFFRLLDAVRNAGDIPTLRMAENEAMWQKLLYQGVHRNHSLRNAAQLAALQEMLTSPPKYRGQPTWSVAARKIDAPGLEVADRNDRRRS